MTKRKRPPTPEPDESTDDASTKDDMVHVTSDMLAGSPDVFAGKKGELRESAPEPTAASMTPTEVRPAAVTAEPVATQPFRGTAQPRPPERRRTGSTVAIGVVFIVLGIFALAVAVSGIDLGTSGWPLFVIVPGLTLLVVGFVFVGSVATVPGAIVTVLGLVLAYSSATDHWLVWFYAWPLVIPGSIGLGLYLQALRDRDDFALRTGRAMIGVGVILFLIGFVLLESIFHISGADAFGPVGQAALPVLLILVGVILLVRSVQKSRASK
jgi:hypothetical protein